MKAQQVVFQDLLNGNIQYIVPLYQRTYSWDEKQWEQLWDDLLEIYDLSNPSNMRKHFIGSVVTQQISSGPEDLRRYILIDGQQRMTTLFILLSVIQERAASDVKTRQTLAEKIKRLSLVIKVPRIEAITSWYNKWWEPGRSSGSKRAVVASDAGGRESWLAGFPEK